MRLILLNILYVMFEKKVLQKILFFATKTFFWKTKKIKIKIASLRFLNNNH